MVFDLQRFVYNPNNVAAYELEWDNLLEEKNGNVEEVVAIFKNKYDFDPLETFKEDYYRNVWKNYIIYYYYIKAETGLVGYDVFYSLNKFRAENYSNIIALDDDFGYFVQSRLDEYKDIYAGYRSYYRSDSSKLQYLDLSFNNYYGFQAADHNEIVNTDIDYKQYVSSKLDAYKAYYKTQVVSYGLELADDYFKNYYGFLPNAEIKSVIDSNYGTYVETKLEEYRNYFKTHAAATTRDRAIADFTDYYGFNLLNYNAINSVIDVDYKNYIETKITAYQNKYKSSVMNHSDLYGDERKTVVIEEFRDYYGFSPFEHNDIVNVIDYDYQHYDLNRLSDYRTYYQNSAYVYNNIQTAANEFEEHFGFSVTNDIASILDSDYGSYVNSKLDTYRAAFKSNAEIALASVGVSNWKEETIRLFKLVYGFNPTSYNQITNIIDADYGTCKSDRIAQYQEAFINYVNNNNKDIQLGIAAFEDYYGFKLAEHPEITNVIDMIGYGTYNPERLAEYQAYYVNGLDNLTKAEAKAAFNKYYGFNIDEYPDILAIVDEDYPNYIPSKLNFYKERYVYYVRLKGNVTDGSDQFYKYFGFMPTSEIKSMLDEYYGQYIASRANSVYKIYYKNSANKSEHFRQNNWKTLVSDDFYSYFGFRPDDKTAITSVIDSDYGFFINNSEKISAYQTKYKALTKNNKDSANRNALVTTQFYDFYGFDPFDYTEITSSLDSEWYTYNSSRFNEYREWYRVRIKEQGKIATVAIAEFEEFFGFNISPNHTDIISPWDDRYGEFVNNNDKINKYRTYFKNYAIANKLSSDTYSTTNYNTWKTEVQTNFEDYFGFNPFGESIKNTITTIVDEYYSFYVGDVIPTKLTEYQEEYISLMKTYVNDSNRKSKITADFSDYYGFDPFDHTGITNVIENINNYGIYSSAKINDYAQYFKTLAKRNDIIHKTNWKTLVTNEFINYYGFNPFDHTEITNIIDEDHGLFINTSTKLELYRTRFKTLAKQNDIIHKTNWKTLVTTAFEDYFGIDPFDYNAITSIIDNDHGLYVDDSDKLATYQNAYIQSVKNNVTLRDTARRTAVTTEFDDYFGFNPYDYADIINIIDYDYGFYNNNRLDGNTDYFPYYYRPYYERAARRLKNYEKTVAEFERYFGITPGDEITSVIDLDFGSYNSNRLDDYRAYYKQRAINHKALTVQEDWIENVRDDFEYKYGFNPFSYYTITSIIDSDYSFYMEDTKLNIYKEAYSRLAHQYKGKTNWKTLVTTDFDDYYGFNPYNYEKIWNILDKDYGYPNPNNQSRLEEWKQAFKKFVQSNLSLVVGATKFENYYGFAPTESIRSILDSEWGIYNPLRLNGDSNAYPYYYQQYYDKLTVRHPQDENKCREEFIDYFGFDPNVFLILNIGGDFPVSEYGDIEVIEYTDFMNFSGTSLAKSRIPNCIWRNGKCRMKVFKNEDMIQVWTTDLKDSDHEFIDDDYIYTISFYYSYLKETGLDKTRPDLDQILERIFKKPCFVGLELFSNYGAFKIINGDISEPKCLIDIPKDSVYQFEKNEETGIEGWVLKGNIEENLSSKIFIYDIFNSNLWWYPARGETLIRIDNNTEGDEYTLTEETVDEIWSILSDMQFIYNMAEEGQVLKVDKTRHEKKPFILADDEFWLSGVINTQEDRAKFEYGYYRMKQVAKYWHRIWLDAFTGLQNDKTYGTDGYNSAHNFYFDEKTGLLGNENNSLSITGLLSTKEVYRRYVNPLNGIVTKTPDFTFEVEFDGSKINDASPFGNTVDINGDGEWGIIIGAFQDDQLKWHDLTAVRRGNGVVGEWNGKQLELVVDRFNDKNYFDNKDLLPTGSKRRKIWDLLKQEYGDDIEYAYKLFKEFTGIDAHNLLKLSGEISDVYNNRKEESMLWDLLLKTSATPEAARTKFAEITGKVMNEQREEEFKNLAGTKSIKLTTAVNSGGNTPASQSSSNVTLLDLDSNYFINNSDTLGIVYGDIPRKIINLYGKIPSSGNLEIKIQISHSGSGNKIAEGNSLLCVLGSMAVCNSSSNNIGLYYIDDFSSSDSYPLLNVSSGTITIKYNFSNRQFDSSIFSSSSSKVSDMNEEYFENLFKGPVQIFRLVRSYNKYTSFTIKLNNISL